MTFDGQTLTYPHYNDVLTFTAGKVYKAKPIVAPDYPHLYYKLGTVVDNTVYIIPMVESIDNTRWEHLGIDPIAVDANRFLYAFDNVAIGANNIKIFLLDLDELIRFGNTNRGNIHEDMHPESVQAYHALTNPNSPLL